jgi:hypothetical protein
VAETKVPPAERAVTAFRQLAVASSDSDTAAKDLGASLSTVESLLRRIGVRVSAWHQIAGHEDPNGPYWTRDLGWAKIKDSWCIAIRKTWGHEHADQHEEEIWPFSEAPRWMAIEGASKLPDLFETLVKRTQESTEKLKARKREADEVALALENVVQETVEQVATAKKGKK